MVHLVREPNRVTANLAKSKIFFIWAIPATFCLFSSFQTNTRPRIPPWKIFLKSTLLFYPSSTLCSFGLQIRKLYIVLSMKASRHRTSVLGKIQESQLLYGSDVIAIATQTNERGVVIAQWICLRLPSCHPGFESQAHHLCFYHYSQFVLYFFMWKERKYGQS